jgi:hypothetical protein
MDAYVELNHGRWIVNCPGCPNAWLENFEIPPECDNCGTAVKVIPPSDKDREKITLAMLPRPVENRNWVPGEKLKDLIAENIAHGVGHS